MLAPSARGPALLRPAAAAAAASGAGAGSSSSVALACRERARPKCTSVMDSAGTTDESLVTALLLLSVAHTSSIAGGDSSDEGGRSCRGTLTNDDTIDCGTNVALAARDAVAVVVVVVAAVVFTLVVMAALAVIKEWRELLLEMILGRAALPAASRGPAEAAAAAAVTEVAPASR